MGDENLKIYITEYYKKLFGDPPQNSVTMMEDRIHDIPQLSTDENELLIKDYSLEEVHEAISQMERNKAPGPDGFPAEFYQTFWEVIKFDLMALFASFQRGDLPLIQQYRPICLLNVSFKIFTKVATIRISDVAHKVIRPTQTAFMPGGIF